MREFLPEQAASGNALTVELCSPAGAPLFDAASCTFSPFPVVVSVPDKAGSEWQHMRRGNRGDDVPPETQFLLLELGPEGPYAIILPLLCGALPSPAALRLLAAAADAAS